MPLPASLRRCPGCGELMPHAWVPGCGPAAGDGYPAADPGGPDLTVPYDWLADLAADR